MILLIAVLKSLSISLVLRYVQVTLSYKLDMLHITNSRIRFTQSKLFHYNIFNTNNCQDILRGGRK